MGVQFLQVVVPLFSQQNESVHHNGAQDHGILREKQQRSLVGHFTRITRTKIGASRVEEIAQEKRLAVGPANLTQPSVWSKYFGS